MKRDIHPMAVCRGVGGTGGGGSVSEWRPRRGGAADCRPGLQAGGDRGAPQEQGRRHCPERDVDCPALLRQLEGRSGHMAVKMSRAGSYGFQTA